MYVCILVDVVFFCAINQSMMNEWINIDMLDICEHVNVFSKRELRSLF